MAILIILVLIIVNGVFVMAEMAVVSSRKARLQQLANEGNAGAGAALELSSNPDKFLSTMQIGITLIAILSGALGERALSEQLAERLRTVPSAAPYSDSLAFVLVMFAIASVTLIIGELVPKRLALLNPEGIASRMSRPMHVLAQVGAPIVSVLSGVTRLMLRILRVHESEEHPVTEEEIKVMIEQGTEAGVFEEAEHEMVKGLFRLSDRAASALMKPRREVVWLDLEESPEEVRNILASSLYSRLPVGNGSLDNVVGIVHTKDLLTQCLAGKPLDLKESLRPPLFVPEALAALDLLETFKKSRTHIALVVDEYGGVEGLITLNDILEGIVGDVASADMPMEERSAVQRPDGSWLLDGKLPVDDVKEILELNRLPEDDSGKYQTLGGFVMLHLGRVPVTGDAFDSEGRRFEVVDMDEKRVDKVLVSRIPEKDTENDDASNKKPAED
jgi:putative hemolysin